VLVVGGFSFFVYDMVTLKNGIMMCLGNEDSMCNVL